MKKFAAFLLAGALICQSGVISSAYSSQMLWLDERESNNSYSEAYTYSTFTEKRGVKGLVNQYDTKDHYKFEAMEDGKMELRFKYEDESPDLRLLISYYNFDGGVNDSERVIADGNDRFFIKVKKGDVVKFDVHHQRGNLTKPYELRYRMK